MLISYITITFRFLYRNLLFTTINMIGLAVSISCVMLIYLYVKTDLTYDEFHKDIDRLYVLGEGARDGSPGEAAYYQTVYPSLPAMLAEFPEIETGTRYYDWEGHMLITGDKTFYHQVHYVDSTFLQVFSFPLIKGDPATALHGKNHIVISEEIALKMFDGTDVIGNVIGSESGEQYVVSGVLDKIPANSTIRPEVLMSLAHKEDDKEFRNIADWYNTITQVIVRLKPNTDIAALHNKFPEFVRRHYAPAAKERTLRVYPLADLRQSQADNERFLYGLSSIGAFILLIAVINFMNLSIAGSLKRLRETGMRKLMGSTTGDITLQFFLEASVLALLASIVSIGIVQLALPLLNSTLGMNLELSLQHLGDAAIVCGFIILLAGIVAGAYPGLYLSRHKIASAVKGTIPDYRGKTTLRNALVVVQFIVSVTLIISVMVTSRQIHFMKTSDLGFNKENVLIVKMDAGYRDEKVAKARLTNIVNTLRGRADVMAVSLSQIVPGRYWDSYDFYLPNDGEDGVSLRQGFVDDTYLDTYGIKILDGRGFSRERADSLHTVIINRAAAQALGWESVEGKTLKSRGGEHVYEVVGIMNDFHYRSLEGKVEPLIHFFYSQSDSFLSVRIAPGKTADVLAFLEREWKALDSWLGFDYFFVDEEFNHQYESVERTLLLIAAFTSVAIVLSCAGIFALSVISAQRRIKEVGIRKVLGASLTNIVGLLSRDYLKLVVIAVLLAGPVAWYGMSQWLNEFAYKTTLEWWIFALSGAAALVVALLTTGVQALRAAMHNPVESLKND